jgi:hypothetical protein
MDSTCGDSPSAPWAKRGLAGVVTAFWTAGCCTAGIAGIAATAGSGTEAASAVWVVKRPA